MKRLSRDTGAGGVPSVPLGRYGSVKEIADATIYLFSDSGNYVNGATLVGKLQSANHSYLSFVHSNDAELLVDGGSWRTHGASTDSGFRYPDFLMSGEDITGVAGMKKSKI